MRKRIIPLCCSVVLLLGLTACGQKGPLYIPPERDTTSPQPEQPVDEAVDQSTQPEPIENYRNESI
ncbi:LPS translocon maturation chaperone LptM [Aliidiomarina maris]|uniref:Lipoprotein n=1 Tax=Aliidiomarina maris TaxID=531312 RepID=A0ABY0BQK9_9GAMM|nr:lipoprotein [Aliidiomarina maris]MBA3988689.1 hypothetical protein [Idiomarina sp.]RUO22806.1 hypothetical protein CWE07_10010 [Aliidiomarina maris]